ncbi:Serine/threonine-protein kinase [Macrolepiota fuliginosa MF-IS2]|uniref:non-specific serine/threonine protein kinase n=1 Tax=Macrolepiota fuliginosa MF-IS2 TaxID=1400762 RepID=A0A9P5X7D5_9AGAR|nr:Serine/threonine-protein kinase [Macrolepiota fuliginosa MF-IS2]
MDSTEELQQLEITALRSIYAEDFIECPPPKAWKGAAGVPEFIIRVYHPDPAHEMKINLHLNVRFPKTYPTLACPTFTIQKPIKGLTTEQVTRLSHAITREAQKCRGSEMVFQIVTFAQEWIGSNVTPPVEVTGSLALQMNQRAMDEERARREREAEEERKAQERAAREEEELNNQIKEDAMRQMVAREQLLQLQHRATTSAMEPVSVLGGDTPMESFGKEIIVDGVTFTAVKLFHARPEGLGTVYMADPVCDDVNTTLPLELYTVTFDSPYYTTTQGRKKLNTLQEEIQRLTLIRHPNLLSVFAVKLVHNVSSPATAPGTSSSPVTPAGFMFPLPPQLMVLTERMPGLTLQDVLEDCASLREDRASGYLSQILSALNAVHLRDLVHRGVSARCIGLAPSAASLSVSSSSSSKVIKLGKVGYYTQLLDLHRSNPFGLIAPGSAGADEVADVPDAWLSNDAKNESSLLYTRRRDIHSVGIVFLQMLLGLDIMHRYNDIHDALRNSSVSPGLAQIALNMISPAKKNHVTCITLLAELAENSFHAIGPAAKVRPRSRGQHTDTNGHGHGYTNGGYGSSVMSTPVPVYKGGMGAGSAVVGGAGFGAVTRSPTLHFHDPKTPVPNPHVHGHFIGSPEIEYFRMPPRTRQASRWKEDWEELELLGKGAFGSVVKARNKIDSRIYAVKKIRLKTQQSDTKIFREVNALSRLSHRFIVRYYTTWVETSENHPHAGAAGAGNVNVFTSDESSESAGITLSVPSGPTSAGARSNSHSQSRSTNGDDDDDSTGGIDNSASTVSERHLPTNGGRFSINMADFDETTTTTADSISDSRGSFPSIHFDRSASPGGSTEDEDEDTESSGSSGSNASGFSGLFERDPVTGLTIGIGGIGNGADAGAGAGREGRRGRPRTGTMIAGRSTATSTVQPTNMTTTNGNGRTEVPGQGLGSYAMGMQPSAPSVTRTLYIQMEFVERQTLRERIDEGITEDEAWRLFGQILDALVHMSTLGILHRDIKLTNIFIDAKGDCKVGDFGLATSSLAAVDPSDVSRQYIYPEADMTLEVGTRLYIAPEVQSRKKGPRNHSKADMYSLGIVFFEMNYMFRTGSERIAVIEDLRKPGIFFPATWDLHRTRQRQIIDWLLQHDPNDRPTALELSESSLMPPKLEDENFKGALNLMAKQDSPYHQAVISSLFTQTPKASRSFLYDSQSDPPEHAALNATVQEHLAAIFRLHGAVDMEPPLLMPVMDQEDQRNHATFIDRHGDLVNLPNNLLVPFARMAARTGIKRIKRYHITNAYKPSPVAGHPKTTRAAVFDIITQDLASGPIAAGAEIIAVINDILNSFPNLSQNYDIHVSHSKIIELTLNRIPDVHRSSVVEIINQTKSSPSQKRALLLRKGLLRSTTDELEILTEVDEDIDNVLSRLERIPSSLATLLRPAINEIQSALQFAASAGVSRPIFFHPLMLGSHQTLFKDGVVFEVVRKNKRMDVLAAGGRYDNVIGRFSPSKQKADAVCATGLQIAVEKITATLAAFQSTSVKTLVKEERSFGFWSPRRCDVYVVSYHPGHLQDRLEVVAYLWQHNISADIMYESGLPNADQESHIDLCAREGILFAVYPRPRTARRDQAAFKVKSILKGAEYELSRQELVGWLQQQIAEQKRADLATSAAPVLSETHSGGTLPSKDAPASSDVQLILPIDAKKQRKQVKQLFLDRAFDTTMGVRSSIQNGMPTVAVDVLPDVFDTMVRNSNWVTDEEAWKPLAAAFSPQTAAYAHQVREAVAKRKAEGHRYVLLFAVREERVQLLSLS